MSRTVSGFLSLERLMHNSLNFSRRHSVKRGFSTLSKDVATGLNYLKTGSDPPLKPDEEYPDWLWELADPEPTLFDLRRKYQAAGKDIRKMDFDEVGRLVKLENRASIKGTNTTKGSSKI